MAAGMAAARYAAMMVAAVMPRSATQPGEIRVDF